MEPIYEKIRNILETTPGLTQKGLAERMGLNPAAVNRMLYGRRNIMAQEIPLIEDYLGVRLDLSGPAPPSNTVEYRQDNRPHVPRRGFSDAPLSVMDAGVPQHMMPVYADAAGAGTAGGVVDWVVRHPSLLGIANAFAVYVSSDAMEPRYFRGELVYLHPGRPPEANRDCLIEMKSGDVGLYRFLQQNERNIRVAQFNPRAEKDIARDDIKAIYAVVGRG